LTKIKVLKPSAKQTTPPVNSVKNRKESVTKMTVNDTKSKRRRKGQEVDDVSVSKNDGGKKKKGGRQQGSNKWMDEVKVLLDIMEDVLPAGSDAWNLVALEAVDASREKIKCDVKMGQHAR